jgi:chlorite dismutase
MADPVVIEVEELIKEIAAKHGVAVSRDDPIIVMQTINHRLMQDTSKAQQAQLDHYKEELEALALHWGNDAKDKAERILNAALSASKDAMHQAMQENAKSTACAVRAEADLILGTMANQLKDAQRIALLNIAASCITLAAAAVSLWVVLR